MEKIKNRNVIILAHVLTTVPAEDLKEYCLQHKAKKILFIAHPLFYKVGRPGSYYEYYENGQLLKTKRLPNSQIPSLLQYIRDFFLTIYWVLQLQEKWDVIVALDNLNTMSGLVLKKLGFIKKVIYYTIDFVPVRFKNYMLNEVYHYIDKIAVQYSDATWNLTERMAEGREKIRGLLRTTYNRQRVVPIGIWITRIPQIPFAKREPHTLMYAGGLVPHQGVQLVLEALPEIIKKVPDIKLKIIGIGSYEDTLKEKTKQLHLSKHVQFLGYMEKHSDVEKILATGGIAMALYSKDLDIWSYYADPSKIKTYLATGLPVITTNVTYIAEELVSRACGIIVEYNKEAVAHAVVDLLSSKKLQENMHESALTFAKQFDWNMLYTKAFNNIW